MGMGDVRIMANIGEFQRNVESFVRNENNLSPDDVTSNYDLLSFQLGIIRRAFQDASRANRVNEAVFRDASAQLDGLGEAIENIYQRIVVGPQLEDQEPVGVVELDEENEHPQNRASPESDVIRVEEQAAMAEPESEEEVDVIRIIVDDLAEEPEDGAFRNDQSGPPA